MMNIKEICAKETYPIRHKILRPHQSFEECKYDTDLLDSTFHIGAETKNNIVSVASFSVELCSELSRSKQYRLRAMATLPEYQRQNIGKSIVAYAEKVLEQNNIDFIWCKGRTEVKGYYEKLGFKPAGEVFNYPGLGPHIIMVKRIN